MKKSLVISSLLLSAVLSYGQILVTLPEGKAFNGWKEGHKTHKWEERRGDFSDAKSKNYSIIYNACVDDDAHPGVRVTGEGFIGMPSPNVFNWYHHGFFDVKVNNKSIFSVPLADMSVVSNGDKGILQFVVDTPEALFHVKFMRVEGDKQLYSQTCWYPKTGAATINSVQFHFLCYPGGFFQDGVHFATTGRATEKQGAKLPLDVKADNYVFFGDKKYDGQETKNGRYSPCYLILDKKHLSSGAVNISSYGVGTVINTTPEAREARFIFADLEEHWNKNVLDMLEAHGAEMREKLDKISFVNSTLMSFDAADALATITENSKQAGDDCKSYIGKLNQACKQLGEFKRNLGTEDAWKCERDFAKQYEEYSRLLMRLKIDAMMHLE